MSEPMPPGFRFHEVHELLASYAASGFTFTDTPEIPGPALASYIRVTLRDLERAAEVVRQLDDLLTVGIFSGEVAGDVELFPQIMPPQGVSVEECLRIARDHIMRALSQPDQFPLVAPQNEWEWRQRFPALHELLGIYFDQDFSHNYSSHCEALREYLSDMTAADHYGTVREIPELLSIATSEEVLRAATETLGRDVAPPQGRTLRQWLLDMKATVEQHLRGQPT